MPFDGRYAPLYLAAIAGLCGLGLRPRGVVEIAGAQRRLERIHNLLERCPVSVHDLSRVEMSRGVPRFNMPFELGLAVEMSRHQMVGDRPRRSIQVGLTRFLRAQA